MTIVFQSSPILKKIFKPLLLLVWTAPLTLSSISYLLSLLPRKYSLIQRRLTRRLLPPYKLLTILQLQSPTSLLPLQLDYSSQFRCLQLINLKLQKNFLQFTRFYPTFDPFYPGLDTSNFNMIILLLEANIAVNIIQITHAEQNDPVSIIIYNTVSNTNSPHGKYSFGIADAKNTQFKAHLSLLNRRSLHFPADVAKPSGASLPPSISIFL